MRELGNWSYIRPESEVTFDIMFICDIRGGRRWSLLKIHLSAKALTEELYLAASQRRAELPTWFHHRLFLRRHTAFIECTCSSFMTALSDSFSMTVASEIIDHHVRSLNVTLLVTLTCRLVYSGSPLTSSVFVPPTRFRLTACAPYTKSSSTWAVVFTNLSRPSWLIAGDLR